MDVIDLTRALPRSTYLRYVPRRAADLEWIVLHHTAGAADEPPVSIARGHLRRGYAGIGYHYLIYRDGTVYKVRPVLTVPACVRPTAALPTGNRRSVCVCFVGTFMDHPPSAAALAAGQDLVRHLRRAYPTLRGVRGHREMPGQRTACPGDAFDLEAYRHSLEVG